MIRTYVALQHSNAELTMDTAPAKPERLRGPKGHYLPRAAEPVVATPVVEAIVAAVEPGAVETPAVETAAVVTPVIAPTIETIAAPAAPKEIVTMATKIQDSIKTQTETFVSQGKAAYEQATTRAKDAYEKGQKTVADMTDFAKGNVEALVASNKAAVAGFETMAQNSAEFAKTSMEKTVAVVKTLAASKSPNEFISTHNEFAKAQFDAAVAEMSKASETLLKVLGEVFEPLSNRMALAADKVAKAGVR